jgi:hypothetical protein
MALELFNSDPDIELSSLYRLKAQASESTFTTFVFGVPGALIGNR